MRFVAEKKRGARAKALKAERLRRGITRKELDLERMRARLLEDPRPQFWWVKEDYARVPLIR